MTRFAALTPEAMTPEQKAVADEIAGGPRGGVRGPFVALLHHPALARRVQALGEHVRFGTQFPDMLIEIGVLVTARHWTCQHEWYAHEKLARRAGVPHAMIGAIAQGRRPEGMDVEQALVHDFCVEVHRDGEPSQQSYDAAHGRYGAEGVLDLLVLCGYYTTLAMVLNTARMPLPDGATSPLAPLDRPN